MKRLLLLSYSLFLIPYFLFSQNVGIGTTQPAAQLHIAGINLFDTARGAIIMSRYWLNSTETRSSAIYHLYNSASGYDQLVLGVSGDGGVNTSPALYSNSKMVIQSNGAVGIGTSTPLQKLHVEGTTFLNGNVGIGISNPNAPLGFPAVLGKKITLYPGGTGDAGLAVQGNLLQIYSDHPNADIAFGYDQGGTMTERMRIKGNGNVGIGTNTPGFPLNFADVPGDKISLFGSSGAHYGFGIQGYLMQIHSSEAAADIAFGYGSSSSFTERMRIKGNGNVGIGTTTPAFPLSFSQTAGDKISLYNDFGDHHGFGAFSSLMMIHAGNFYSNIAFGYGRSSNFTERMRITNYGEEGLALKGRIVLKNGTDPINTDSGPGIWFNKADNSGLLGFLGSQNNQNIGFYGGPAGYGFTYDAVNSRVGIGTAIPAASLEVNGYTKLGSDAPSIKMKKIAGTTAPTDGNFVHIVHGLNYLKILSVSVLVACGPCGPYTWIPPNNHSSGVQFYWLLNGGTISVTNAPGDSINILSQPIKIVITYEE